MSSIAFEPQIAAAASKYHLDVRLLEAVAAQETGGPGCDSGRNVVGDGGHGHGIFQIDDRFHAFARTAAAMDPAQNAGFAARMISGLLRQFGGNVHKALSAYNAGDPNARGTTTVWQDGARLGYADSVLRHYRQLGATRGEVASATPAEPAEGAVESTAEPPGVDALAAFAALSPPAAPPQGYSYQRLSASGNASESNFGGNVAGLVDPADGDATDQASLIT